MGINIEKVVTEKFEMRYFRFGSGEKVMVMLPGISIKSVMESADFVAGAYKMFSPKYTVYLFDRRTDIPETYTVDEMGEDTAAAMTALGLKDTYMVGVSQGGCMAQIIAADHPELVKKLVLESTVSRLSDDAVKTVGKWVEYARAGDKDALNLEFAESIYSDAFWDKYRDAILSMARLYTDDELARFVRLAEGMNGYTVYERLDSVHCPVLVMGGSDDRIFSQADLRETAEKLHGELYLFESYGHAFYDEADEAKQRILDFFEKTAAYQ